MISFQNDGLIDPRCISTIGVSVKESENPIGFFGTGLKYAIAIILRKGGTFTVWRGLEAFKFDSVQVGIRGQPANIVRMNGAELGFTTHLGEHWEAWQAFREMWCNTKDEGGETIIGEIEPAPDKTTIHVSLPEFEDCFNNRHKYILETEPEFAGPIASFHLGPSNGIFYRSILVSCRHDKPFLFTPNILERTVLTEDRTIKDQYEATRTIAKAVLQCDDELFLDQFICASKDFAEHEFDLDWPGVKPSTAFLAVVGRACLDTSRPLNHTAMSVFVRESEPPPAKEADLLPHEMDSLKSAIEFCARLRYPVDEFPIHIVESLGEGILGQADRKTRSIMIARRAIQMGDMTLASTLIEEWVHIKHGVNDCSREMQNWLFEQLTTIGAAYLFACNAEKETA